MERGLRQRKQKLSEAGQGLVETVLILPFLLILIIGIVELGIVLQRQITVVNAAREGARFGAFGGPTENVYTQTVNAATQGFLEIDRLKVGIIRAEISGPMPAPRIERWETYPDNATFSQERLLETLRVKPRPDIPASRYNELRLVIVTVEYDHQSLLGLPIVSALAERIPIGSWTAMRIHGRAR
jgi:Flp pilus assembly protein TadG